MQSQEFLQVREEVRRAGGPKSEHRMMETEVEVVWLLLGGFKSRIACGIWKLEKAKNSLHSVTSRKSASC
jgi:hypothetical protein